MICTLQANICTATRWEKQIVIYYGSMMRLFDYLDDEGMRREIARVLRHELKHHIEVRAGIRSLEKWDEEQMQLTCREGFVRKGKGKNESGMVIGRTVSRI